ncbi:uncharacterized protein LOC141693347 [Apium graveolens]|uniref:uncharacterized protein LOC141693347 n=1 Tax=Apium graveolens TaxID=4045 RepID=UPI003D7ABABD
MSRHTVNKTLTIVGGKTFMNPTVDPSLPREVVRVEIQPNERWTGGSTVHVQAFKVFSLTRDAVSYSSRKRSDLADRCISRAGQFLSDFTYNLNEFKNDVDGENVSRLTTDLANMTKKKRKYQEQYVEIERRVGDMSNANSKLSKHIREMEFRRDAMSKKVEVWRRP